MEGLQEGLNGVEVVMFREIDLVDSTTAHCAPVYPPQSRSVLQGTKRPARGGIGTY
jgi:hypothetical protein